MGNFTSELVLDDYSLSIGALTRIIHRFSIAKAKQSAIIENARN